MQPSIPILDTNSMSFRSEVFNLFSVVLRYSSSANTVNGSTVVVWRTSLLSLLRVGLLVMVAVVLKTSSRAFTCSMAYSVMFEGNDG